MDFKFTPWPHVVRRVSQLEGTAWGKANAFVISVEDDAPIYVYQHELEHVKQWYITLALHPILYYFSKRYRLWSEVNAYKKSIKYGRSLKSCALGLTKKGYDLGLTFEEAEKLLGS